MTIKAIQALLNAWIVAAGMTLTKLKVDGVPGPKTTYVVKAFQKAHNLKVDGKPGPLTQYELMFYKYKYFRKEEFRCKCDKFCNGFPVRVDEQLLILLTKIRNHFGKPININSAIRCTQHNKNVGGVSDSNHIKGNAADIRVEGVSPSTVYAYADSINPNDGVGKYDTFTHVDNRGVRARWRG